MKKLKDFLKLNNISYRELAKGLGISPATLSEIINNNRLPTLKLAYEIERLTFKNVTIYDWLDETVSHDGADYNTQEKKNKKKT